MAAYYSSSLLSGGTLGVFKLEGWGYLKNVERLSVRASFTDVVDLLNALYRPGPGDDARGGRGLDGGIYSQDGKERNEMPRPFGGGAPQALMVSWYTGTELWVLYGTR